MRFAAAILAVSAAACGDNSLPDGELLGTSSHVAIASTYAPGVFAPDLDDIVARHLGTTIVFVNATSRRDALNAYGDRWSCGWIEIENHEVEHCRADALRLSIAFLDLPPLADLWTARADTVTSTGSRSSKYTQQDIVDVIAHVIGLARPSQIRTHEPVVEDPDRALAGAIALLAIAEAKTTATVIAFSDGGGRHASGMRRTARGKLALGVECMDANSDGSVRLVPCVDAPVWTLAPDRTVRLSQDRCLQTLLMEELVVGACSTGPRYTYFLDDNGYLFTGQIPLARGDHALAPLAGLLPVGGRVRSRGLLASELPRWTVAPEIASSTIALGATGRAVRLADVTGDGLADLCAQTTGLRCAPGNGDGTFGALARVDTGLAIEPTSLAFGDVDGDDRIDACGHVTSGILCALAADDFAASPWSTAFDPSETIPGTTASIAIANADGKPGAEICGLASSGLICIAPDGPTSPPARSTTPMDPTWLVDLDGDDRVDWCTGQDGALVCGRDRDVDRAGTIWSDDPPAGSTDSTSFGDLDGDGFADRCTLTSAGEIYCSRGQGYAFGPAFAVPGLAGTPAIGDLDGDGVADLCTDAVRCVIPPPR